MEPPAGRDGLLVQEIVYAGLEALRSALPLDLCAYLHVSGDLGPQLFLLAPDLSQMSPTEAFNLFSELRDAFHSDAEGEETLSLGGYFTLGVSSRGPRSRGFHAVGRRDRPLDDRDREVAARLCRAVASVGHAMEAIGERPAIQVPSPARVAVEMAGDITRAEVAVSLGGEVRTGTGEAPSPTRAVALAVIDAVDQELKLAEATEGDVGTERAVLVLLSDELGRTALGAALCGSATDPLQATASATIEAASRLGRVG